jgi:alkylation response protein AidB-like acyl-CoA dehydrogenase
MDFSFNEVQSDMRDTARRLLERASTPESVRQWSKSSVGFDKELWTTMAGLGWIELGINEARGGTGAGLVTAGLVFEELGRAACSTPLLPVVMAAHALSCLDSPEAQLALSQAVTGDPIVGLGWLEHDGRWPSTSASTARLIQRAEIYSLSGSKTLVPAGDLCDRFLVFVRTGSDEYAAVIVEPGVSCSRSVIPTISSIGEDRLAQLEFDGYAITAREVIATGDGVACALDRALTVGRAMLCCSMAGAARRVLKMAVDYALERHAFGRPIGSNQAIKHKLSDMLIAVEGCWLLAYETVGLLDQGVDASMEVAMSKAWCSRYYRKVTADAMQVFGAAGLVSDNDTTIFYRRAKCAETLLGDSHEHLTTVLSQMLA